eukprot:Phypoly_transcript_00790.p1 GENE.Phypoly_transcript_00790~~Phypoly_transcript_00790.p1  ORF type:complete len:679 (+),score=76.67 Phypoly_transcript_00790:1578-3614(+)
MYKTILVLLLLFGVTKSLQPIEFVYVIFLTNTQPSIIIRSSCQTIKYSVTDFKNVTVASGSVNVSSSDNTAHILPNLNDNTGYFDVSLYALTNNEVVATAETVFGVIPDNSGVPPNYQWSSQTHFAQGMNTDILPLLKLMGLRFVRDEMYWSAVETKEGIYNFSGYQAYADTIKQNGIQMNLELDFGNILYENYDNSDDTGPTTDQARQGYVNYAQAALNKFGTNFMPTVEVWNEWTGDNFLVGPATQNRTFYYTNMLKTTYQTLKANSELKNVVVGGGATSSPCLPYFNELFALGALEYIDAIAFHPYSIGVSEVPYMLADLTAIQKQYISSPKPVWATEFSDLNGEKYWAVQYLTRMCTYLVSNNVQMINWYYSMAFYSWFSPYIALLNNETSPYGQFTPTPLYVAYSVVINQLTGAQAYGQENLDSKYSLASSYLFEKNGKQLRVVFTTEIGHNIIFTAGPSTSSVVTFDVMGVMKIISVTPGENITLTLTYYPAYIQGDGKVTAAPGPLIAIADSFMDFAYAQGVNNWELGSYVYQDSSSYQKFQPFTTKLNDMWNYWYGPNFFTYQGITRSVSTPLASPNTEMWTVWWWVSFVSGTIRVQGTFGPANPQSVGSGVLITIDGQVAQNWTSLPNRPAYSFDVTLSVNKGSNVDFAVAPLDFNSNFGGVPFYVRIF